MNEILDKCNSIINELMKFSSDLVYLGPAIIDNRLEVFETQIGFKFPIDFMYLLKAHNRISLAGTEIYGFDNELRGASLDEVYRFEHDDFTFNKMPLQFLPFSPDGRGNHYCLNLKEIRDGLCPVVFWQHDFIYDGLNDVEVCNNSLMDWIDECMIQWTLEDYDYDGIEKKD